MHGETVQIHRLRVFQKGVKEVCGAKRDGVTGEWRKLRVHNEQLYDCTATYIMSSCMTILLPT
jgi:hypothetical protein